MRNVPGGRPRVVFRDGDRLGNAVLEFRRNFGWEGPKSERRIARIVVAEVGVVERIYQIHPEVNSSFAVLVAENGPRKVSRNRKVEILLARWTNVERTWGIAQRALDGAHKRGRIDERFTRVASRTI